MLPAHHHSLNGVSSPSSPYERYTDGDGEGRDLDALMLTHSTQFSVAGGHDPYRHYPHWLLQAYLRLVFFEPWGSREQRAAEWESKSPMEWVTVCGRVLVGTLHFLYFIDSIYGSYLLIRAGLLTVLTACFIVTINLGMFVFYCLGVKVINQDLIGDMLRLLGTEDKESVAVRTRAITLFVMLCNMFFVLYNMSADMPGIYASLVKASPETGRGFFVFMWFLQCWICVPVTFTAASALTAALFVHALVLIRYLERDMAKGLKNAALPFEETTTKVIKLLQENQREVSRHAGRVRNLLVAHFVFVALVLTFLMGDVYACVQDSVCNRIEGVQSLVYEFFWSGFVLFSLVLPIIQYANVTAALRNKVTRLLFAIQLDSPDKFEFCRLFMWYNTHILRGFTIGTIAITRQFAGLFGFGVILLLFVHQLA